MRFKTLLNWPWLAVGSAGIVLFSVGIFFSVSAMYAQPRAPVAEIAPAAASEISQNLVADKPVEKAESSLLRDQVISELPVRLKIPKINVNAVIEPVGLTPQGAMDVPKGPTDVAWYSLGVRPGEEGSAVLSGHYGWKNNIPAVFDNLHKLQKGDKIYVEGKEGAVVAFVVRELRSFGENDEASAVFSSSDGKAHLNLVTCEGVWNKNNKSYSNRLVVFADAE